MSEINTFKTKKNIFVINGTARSIVSPSTHLNEIGQKKHTVWNKLNHGDNFTFQTHIAS